MGSNRAGVGITADNKGDIRVMESCGNCGHCVYNEDTGEFICTCEATGAYGLEVTFIGWCEEWYKKDVHYIK